MNEPRQGRALFGAFLGRFFENEMSAGSRDMKASFFWIIAALAAPGMLLPVTNLFRWSMLTRAGTEVFRREIVADKTVYLSMSMGAVMLLAAVVWQALLVDRRDAIVLGSFPVRARVIVGSKIAALLAYLGIVAGGMHIVASVMYGVFLATTFSAFYRGILGHFIAASAACMFACLAVAALQATILAIGGPKLFARVTAGAQLLLAAAGLLLFFMSPVIAAGALDYVRGNDRSAWVLWMPPVWFLGLYETILGSPPRGMPAMAGRALIAFAAGLGLLVAIYPLAYRRVVTAAMQGSPLGGRVSLMTRLGRRVVALMPGGGQLRGAAHFMLLTLGRVGRMKLVLATALGVALALSLPFVLSWTRRGQVAAFPSMSQMAVPFVWVICILIGLRTAYSIPSDLPAGWIFTTAVKPHRVGVRAARTLNLMFGGFMPAAICALVYGWFWSAAVALFCAFAVFGVAVLIGELLLGGIAHVPFTRAYNPERAQLQARWPVYLVGAVLFLQFVPWAVRLLLVHGYGLVPGTSLILAAMVVRLHRSRAPEPPVLEEAEFENKPLALRLY
jgi:hypothetical protein